MEYLIKKARHKPSLKGRWNETAWQGAHVLNVANFLKRGSMHRPKVEAKLVYTDKALFVFFRVSDKYVRCIRTDYQASVCRDSCVEFFVRPRKDHGYFNFEINCGGTMLLYYIEDHARRPGGFKKISAVPERIGDLVKIYHSMPQVVYPEIKKSAEWLIEYMVPFRLFEKYTGALGKVAGQTWYANFYKCADHSSRPHWAAWAPLHGKCNFHLPQYFAPIRFE